MQTATSAHVCTQNTPGEYISGLPAWDRVPRLDAWLPHVLGESPQSVGMNRMQYLTLVGRQWLMGMVHRAQEPGSKFDFTPVLQGPQGTGKSALLRTLVGKDFFSDDAGPMSWGKGRLEEMQEIWLYEINELTAFRASELDGINAFIKSTTDSYRPPYSEKSEFFPRQFVVAVTTHNTALHKDRLGKRFWVVPVRNHINTQWLREHRDQLFAEALARNNAGQNDHVLTLNYHPGNPLCDR
ncbi:VapE domain-containing protein [Comamonas terrigena]|uniref:VapE domain-containing protein n=1 Tax=Comamonas terrigena TaxID=32013 RepID=UPI002353F2A9|nr:VapE domain-containing protein [Comamonas terrigena]